MELFIAGNPFSLEDGEKTHYVPELMDLLPQIHVIDGVSACVTMYTLLCDSCQSERY